MSEKGMGKQTVALKNPPSITAGACVVGKKEGDGPLKDSFDYIGEDSFFGMRTWEMAESEMQKTALREALRKAELTPSALNYIFAGDLLSQCIGSAFGMREMGIPFFGLYGACSTMAEGLALAAMTIDGGFADNAAAVTSSHFCSAERQFRFPLEYGGQRTPTSQWTVTGAGAAILSGMGVAPYVTHVTAGKLVDAGVKDANNMGAAMAPAAFDTLTAHFTDTGRAHDYYDLILTGDLGELGGDILLDLFAREGVDIKSRYNDCGRMIYPRDTADSNSGASGCGCSAAVLMGHVLRGMRAGKWNNVLFAATGALMSTTSSQQGESIPSICTAVSISNMR
ncbi:MAG: stage V sporulation protein AD [Oscillospiraceae bacterium]|jgi:stage V sporulation protein AD|nr:stage V sporulation protein AD [Oscillospiraceae bacterium]